MPISRIVIAVPNTTCLLHLGGTFLVRERFFKRPSFVHVTSPNNHPCSLMSSNAFSWVLHLLPTLCKYIPFPCHAPPWHYQATCSTPYLMNPCDMNSNIFPNSLVSCLFLICFVMMPMLAGSLLLTPFGPLSNNLKALPKVALSVLSLLPHPTPGTNAHQPRHCWLH